MYEMGAVDLVLFIMGAVLVLVPVTLAVSVLRGSQSSRLWKTYGAHTESMIRHWIGLLLVPRHLCHRLLRQSSWDIRSQMIKDLNSR